jgi:hypothetical protein
MYPDTKNPKVKSAIAIDISTSDFTFVSFKKVVLAQSVERFLYTE